MSFVAVYGDVHLTKRMGNLQSSWDHSALEVFRDLYRNLNNRSVDFAVCLGDFFDAPKLEAKSVKLVTSVLSIINNSSFPTYFLLGNHEIFDEDSNILDFLSEYENITPVTDIKVADEFLYVPYSYKLEDIPLELMSGRYLFTHHDIYGSKLAGGKVTASFGSDPGLLNTAKKVFNGHVHLASEFGNIMNVGSLLKMQQGELALGEFPRFLFLDTAAGVVNLVDVRENFIAPLTIDQEDYQGIFDLYPESVKFILRIEYSDSLKIPVSSLETSERVLKYRVRKDIRDNPLDSLEVKKKSIDVKEIISSYIRKDSSVLPEDRERLIALSMELLGAQI